MIVQRRKTSLQDYCVENHTEYLLAEWDKKKNGKLTPKDVFSGSAKKAWWILSYDDKKTGRHFEFSWEARISDRAGGHKCPYLTGKKIWKGFNDLTTTHPELAAEWHPSRNGDLRPENVMAGSNKKVWWQVSYDDKKTKKHFDFEWEAVVAQRAKGASCPYTSGKAVWKGFNDLATTHPELAAQWHPVKNGNLKPEHVSAGSGKKVWWILSCDDSKTGKHFEYERYVTVAEWVNGGGRRLYNRNLDVSKNGKVSGNLNNLAAAYPELAAQWHPTRNGSLLPEDVSIRSGRKVWWIFPYDDPKTGRHFDFEWETPVGNRTRGRGCPYLSGHKVWKGFNDLATVRPEIAAQWHPTKNGTLTPEDVTEKSAKNVWWQMSYVDEETGERSTYEWQAVIANRVISTVFPYPQRRNNRRRMKKAD